ncbi:MAG: M16 family metallopeptidase [Candidatus Berkiella sp.]
MTSGSPEKSQLARWMKIIVITLAVVGVLLFVKYKYYPTTASAPAQGGELTKMMGIQNKAPQKLESFKEVKGVIDVQYWVTPQGVPVYFVPVRTLPMVDIQMVFDAGAARNGSKGGLAYLTNTLLAEGTQKMSADIIAESFDRLGAQYSAESQRDMASLHLRSLSEPSQLIPAVQTLAELVSMPSFPEQGFKREQQNALSALKQQSQSPNQVASRAFYTALYPNQPYSNWVLGDEKTIAALTVDDVKAFFKQYYVTKNLAITIVGDLSSTEADAIAQTLVKDMAQGEKPAPIQEVSNLSENVVRKVNFPSAQTHILLGEPGIKHGDPDYYALYLGNHILGGNGSVTRIFDIIRNKNGLAYSAYSYFVPMRERGPFVIGCQTRNDQADKALQLMQGLLQEFLEKGPTDEELAQAKKNLLGGYALRFDSNASISQQLSALAFYGLPLDYFDKFKPAIERIDAKAVKEAFQKRIATKNMVVVMVGGEAQPAPKPSVPNA